MATLKYKDGSVWKELNVGGASNALVNVVSLPNHTISYTNTSGTDKGTIRLNSNGTGSFNTKTTEDYTITENESKFSIKRDFPASYTIDFRVGNWALEINPNNSDPEKAITYIGDLAGTNTGWNTWKDRPGFCDIKPCILKAGGEVNYYLNPDNYTLKENGSPSDLTGEDGDVMIEIPVFGWKFEYNNTTKIVTLNLTTESNKEGYCYLAHSLNSEGDCDKLYIGAYLLSRAATNKKFGRDTMTTSVDGSISGGTPTAGTALSNHINYINFRNREDRGANPNDGSYQSISFYPLTLIQILYLFVFKNFNSQAVIGMGYNNSSESYAKETGITDKNAFFSYSINDKTSENGRVKCFGIEDLWGNGISLIAGVQNATGRTFSYWISNRPEDINTISFANSSYNAGYQFSVNSQQTYGGFPTVRQYSNYGGFAPGCSLSGLTSQAASTSGSSTTYQCDYCTVVTTTSASYIAFTGSTMNLTGCLGLFGFSLDTNYYSYSGWKTARLIYRKLKK